MRGRRIGLRAAVAACALVMSMLVTVASASASAPAISGEWSKSVTAESATVRAEISPEGSRTTYRVEYGPSTSYGTVAPVPDGTVGEGTEPVKVSQPLTGLQAGTAYHYRFVVANGEGTTLGADEVLRTFPAAPAALSDGCPNAEVRGIQFAAYLPDCRAYELVSPPDKNGVQIAAEATKTQASVTGDAIKFVSAFVPFGDAQGSEPLGAEYVSQRSSDGSGWMSHGINPNFHSRTSAIFGGSQYEAFSEDLSRGVYYSSAPVLSGYPNIQKADSLYLRNDILSTPPGSYELLSNSIEPLPERSFNEVFFSGHGVGFAAASSDWSRILFESKYDLTTEAQGLSLENPKTYEWHDGTVRLAGVLPNGEPAPSSIPGRGVFEKFGYENSGGWEAHTLSTDGSRVVFVVPTSSEATAGKLYMRIDGETTIPLDVSERSTPDTTEGESEYAAATPDDSKVYFTSAVALTDDAEVSASRKLYEYDVNAPAGKHLKLISIDNEPSEGANEPSLSADGVAAVTSDGSYVYFTDKNMLLRGQSPGNKEDFLYVWHEGAVRVIAQQAEGSQKFSWGSDGLKKNDTVRITPDGRTVLFLDGNIELARSLGYDNLHEPCGLICTQVLAREANARHMHIPQCYLGEQRLDEEGHTAESCIEAYIYNYDTGAIKCVSCDPTGARPLSDTRINSGVWESTDQNTFAGAVTQYLNRPLSSNGRYVFFDTYSPLVAQDTNGTSDVYEYDLRGGGLHLITSGMCDCESRFVDASPDGRNVFFETGQQLVHADFDNSLDLYDARVEGGIASQNVPPPVACTGEECQGPSPGAPVFSVPASASFSGIGNPSVSTVKASVKRAAHHKRKRRHRHKKRRHGPGKLGKRASRRTGR